jgi:predicted PurR-regulated permease PerM
MNSIGRRKFGKALPRLQKNPSKSKVGVPYIEVAIRLGALGLLLYWSFILVRPFISIVIWSVVLAVALYPFFERVANWLSGRRRLAAFVVTMLSLLIVIGPATWLAFGLIDSLRLIAEHFDLSTLAIPPPPISLKHWPLIGDPIYQYWLLATNNLHSALLKIAPQLKPVITGALRISANTGIGVLKFFISIIVAGFLFSSGPSIVEAVKMLSRKLNPTRGEEFVNQAGSTIRAISRGVIGISVLQALFADIGLTAAGVPHAGLITFAVLILGIVQIGPSIIIIPIIIWSWTVMETSSAVFFTAYMIPVNLMDNILRPIVIGRGLKTPMLVILVGVIGGTIAYGITGLFLGPIVLAVIWELLVSWTSEQNGA